MAHGRRRKKGHAEGHGNSERWLLTYADMITLLTAFFILMYSMSVMNLSKFQQVAIAIRSGFGGELQGGKSVLNPAPGVISAKPSVIPELSSFQPARIAEQLRQYIKQKGLGGELRVRSTERGLVVSIVTDKMLFPKGQARITSRAAHLLDKIVSLLRGTNNHIRVEGHTDDLPIHTAAFPSNWELSTARATTVVRYLIAHEGFDPGRLSAAGYADSRPVAPNDSEAHRAMNRRVDLVILRGPETDSG